MQNPELETLMFQKTVIQHTLESFISQWVSQFIIREIKQNNDQWNWAASLQEKKELNFDSLVQIDYDNFFSFSFF